MHGMLYLIMIPAGGNNKLILLNGINQPVFPVDSSGPDALQVVFQTLGFAFALKGVLRQLLISSLVI